MAPLPGVGLGAVDIQETPTSYIFKVDVPGLSKDDVKGAGPVVRSRYCVVRVYSTSQQYGLSCTKLFQEHNLTLEAHAPFLADNIPASRLNTAILYSSICYTCLVRTHVAVVL